MLYFFLLKGEIEDLKPIFNYYMRKRSTTKFHLEWNVSRKSGNEWRKKNRQSKWRKSWIWILNNLNISSHFISTVSSTNAIYIITILSYILHLFFLTSGYQGCVDSTRSCYSQMYIIFCCLFSTVKNSNLYANIKYIKLEWSTENYLAVDNLLITLHREIEWQKKKVNVFDRSKVANSFTEEIISRLNELNFINKFLLF